MQCTSCVSSSRGRLRHFDYVLATRFGARKRRATTRVQDSGFSAEVEQALMEIPGLSFRLLGRLNRDAQRAGRRRQDQAHTRDCSFRKAEKALLNLSAAVASGEPLETLLAAIHDRERQRRDAQAELTALDATFTREFRAA